ncbi:probable transmembrane GTPase FZO-like, chloroplastic [Rutidosis leptorrhynchoides]|uniref:probable transmembrane GTPase FZO-like, chloroplastic n=1 Tax=Rutidosis leptorrhynchoides TaxID=125765 RepID=UPI003A99E247
MISLHHSISFHRPIITEQHLNFFHHRRPPSLYNIHRRRATVTCIEKNGSFIANTNRNQQQQQPERTLFPGGYKRPEIKIPNVVLELNPNDVLDDEMKVIEVVDQAVSGIVGVVVLNSGDGSGRVLYDAACMLKSVIRDRAYLLIAERVDIATAVNASGVVVSDQGLPAIVARNTIMDSKSDTVFLPLVGRKVQNSNAAMNASSFEGADFIIYDKNKEESIEEVSVSVINQVKIPTFVTVDTLDKDSLINEMTFLLQSGASGLVVSLQGLKLLGNDALDKIYSFQASDKRMEGLSDGLEFDRSNGFPGGKGLAGFINLEDREAQLIETERSLLLEAINVIKRASPMMEEVSLLSDAVSHLSEPFLLVIVGEFNSGKSTFINALLGRKYLKDGVIPTTNEITFLKYSELDSDEQQRCERHPDGQYICYLPAPILENMIIVDTPGTNVILQRQQRLTEEFVPRADLLLFVISADRPLTESEVSFLRYTQQWKKRVVFVLNKSDIYQTPIELEEAIGFINENTQKVLNNEVTLFPVSARSALKRKLSTISDIKEHENDSHWETTSFYALEKFLYSFLDTSTSTGTERVKLKLETPIAIAEQLISASQKLVERDCQQAKKDLVSINELINSVTDYAFKMETESISWKKQSLSLIDKTQSRIVDVIVSTLRLSNIDIVVSYVFRGGNKSPMPAAASVRNDIIGPALLESQKLQGEYAAWLQSNNAREIKYYEETFEQRWASFKDSGNRFLSETRKLVERRNEFGIEVVDDFSAAAASKLFEEEIREVFLGTFGAIGTAGLLASLLTSVLPTTLEDLLALGLCSAGGYIAIASFPVRRQKVIDKVKRTADSLARKLDEAMQKDLLETTESLANYVKLVGKPYQELAQSRLDELVKNQDELTKMEERIKSLQIDVQNLHRSS